MKTNRIARTLLSLVLVLCMVAPMFLMSANAEEKTTFNYVSIGASNTNGYGMRGYITEEELELLLSGQASKDDVNVYGYERTPEGAYPDLIRDHYVGIYGAENVKINQLAISSMRVEELRILLDDSYMGDDYSSWRFTGSDGWFLSAEPGGIEALRAAYKESITNADLITVDIGWNNFGVYVCNQLVDYMSNGKYKWTTDVTKIFPTDAEDQAALQAKEIIRGYIVNYVGEGEMANALTDIFAYSILGYIHNFDIVMEKIYTLNPDADVVVLGIQNLLYGVVVDIGGEKMPLGTIFGNFVNMANYYASACSPFQSQYQYVKVGKDEHVTIFLDYMKSYKDGTAADLDQNVKDCFDYYDNDLFIQTRVDYMAAELIKQMIAEEGIPEDTALSFLGCKDWMEVVAMGKKGELPTLMGTNYQELFDGKYWPALNAAYDTLAVLVKEIAVAEYVDANGLLGGTVNISAVEDALIQSLEAEIQENAISAANGGTYTVDLEKILPDADSKVVAAMYIRYYMGNSFFAHPNGTGHLEIKNGVINVLNKPETETDQKLDSKLIESVEQIHELLCGGAGHEKKYTTTVAATCDKEGLTVTSCACGKEKTETVHEKITHSYTAGEPVWAEDYASCSITLSCGNCDATITETDDTVTSEQTKEATCKEAGEIVYTADFSESEYIDEAVTITVETEKLAHSYKSVVTAPTCTAKGYTTYTCEVCGDSYTGDEVAALGHDWEDATCTTPKTCSVCDATDGKALGHEWDEGVVTKEPTKEEPGIRTYTCERCEDTKTEEIPYVAPEIGTVRLYGDDRVETAIKVADQLKEVLGKTSFDTIIIANGDNFADALSGSYLATVKEAPILLYRAKGVELNEKYITENLSKGGIVYILGGTAAVPAEVETRLKDAGFKVERLYGDTRFDTNLKILEEAGIEDEEILVCTGWEYADSLSASATGLPILMLNTEADQLTENQIKFLQTYSENDYTIIGGTSAVSEDLETIVDYFGGKVERVYGDSREETSVKVAERYFQNPDYVVLAYSRNFPDGLCGGPLANALGAPLLLVNSGKEAYAAFYVAKNDIVNGYILGGTAAVSDDTIKIVFGK